MFRALCPVLGTFVLLAQGCASPGATMPSSMVVSSSHESEAEFRRVDRLWRDRAAHPDRELEQALVAFLAAYPSDGQAARVRSYLAWVCVASKQYERANEQLDQLAEHAARIRDFARFVRATIWVKQGRAQQVLSELRALRGVLIGVEERALLAETLLDAMLLTRNYADLTDIMLDWVILSEAAAWNFDNAALAARLERIPTRTLADALFEVERRHPLDPPGQRAHRTVAALLRDHLGRAAIRGKDVALAQRLLERIAAAGTADERLLAVASVQPPRIEGRKLGLLLELDSEELRMRSAAVLGGVSAALALESARGPEAVKLGIAQVLERGPDAHAQTALQDGPDDKGSRAAAHRRALAELAAEGASIVIAGVSTFGAREAARFAEEHMIPVILLGRLTPSPAVVPAASVTSPPTAQSDVPGRFVFETGVSEAEVEIVFAAWTAQRHLTKTAVVAGVGSACSPPDLGPTAAGSPLESWRATGVDGVLLAGDAWCAAASAEQIAQSGLELEVVLGLAATPLAGGEPAIDHQVSTGLFPLTDLETMASVSSWVAKHGAPPGWSESLGHDAAWLGQSALGKLPVRSISAPREVTDWHRRVGRELGTVATT